MIWYGALARDWDAGRRLHGRNLTTYHCGWCGWNGTRIQEQAHIILRIDVSPPRRETVYGCWMCGMEVQPGPHNPDPGYGNRP